MQPSFYTCISLVSANHTIVYVEIESYPAVNHGHVLVGYG